jgi:adenylate kinase
MTDERARRLALVFLGPPGAGKGTQAKMIAERYAIPHVSTGDLLRDNVARGTELGAKAKAIMARGDLVPDMLVCDMVASRLRQPDAEHGFILDGFPRTVGQAEWLDAFLGQQLIDNSQNSKTLPIVIQVNVDYNQLLRRLTGRRTCPTGHIYNIYLQPPRVDETCDVDGLKLVQRNDDREEVIRERLAAYERQTKPLMDYYWNKGRLVTINGDSAVQEVTGQMIQAIEHMSTAEVKSGRR